MSITCLALRAFPQHRCLHPQVFYIFGAVGLAWTVWWERLMGDIARQEPEAAQSLLQGRPNESAADSVVPWRAFLRNRPVQALAVTHFTNNW